MLNKIVLVMFVGLVAVTSVPAFADNQDLAAKSLNDVNDAANQNAKIQSDPAVSGDNQYNAGSGQGDSTAPPTAWLLGLALLGFVVLSNRSSV